MKLRKKMKRIGAMILSVMLMMTGMPMTVFAENIAEPPDTLDAGSTAADIQDTEDILLPDLDEVVLGESSDEEEILASVEDDIEEPTEPVDSPLPEDDSLIDEELISENVTVEGDDQTDDIPQEPDNTEEIPDDTVQGEQPGEDEELPEDESVEDVPKADENDEVADDEGIDGETELVEDDMPDLTRNLQEAIKADGFTYAMSYGCVQVFADDRLSEVLYKTEGGWNIWLATACSDSGSVTVYGLDEMDHIVKGYLPDGNLDEELLLYEDAMELIDELPCQMAETTVCMMYLFTVAGMWMNGESGEETFEQQEPCELVHQPGDYIEVTKDTRVFLNVDDSELYTDFPDLMQGHFTRNAAVQIQSVEEDSYGQIWYQVSYLYGDSLSSGPMKGTAYATIYVMAKETNDTEAAACTVTDYAYTDAQLNMLNKMALMYTATTMNGFSLKAISGKIGQFTSMQSNLRGSSGRDGAYPQIAKSASHGTIYATPHYLEGNPVYCLEHTLDGPGEGSGSNMTPTGPYTLYDLTYYLNNADAGGGNGVRYSARTMHAIAWVLRHSYPFMVLNRSDSNNETWSRVAGQFAVREVIKQLEGSRYVRSYWNMNSFYAFSGGAPSVYLEYARWLATNAIQYANSTDGEIAVTNQSTTYANGVYTGTMKVTTNADHIRIAKSVGTITGNTGDSDSTYYYLKSGDTVSITSGTVPFTVPMESMPSANDESSYLVGVPLANIQKIIVPISGELTPLKSAGATFDYTAPIYGIVEAVKISAENGSALSGAEFELLNSTGTIVAVATTNNNGRVIFENIAPGKYTIREKAAPLGYSLSESSSQDITVTAGETTTTTFANSIITGKVRIYKTDSGTQKPLAGATFTVTRLSGPAGVTDIGKVVATITTDAAGYAETNSLPWGEYKVAETGIPDGYLDDSYSVIVTIK